MKLMHLSLVVLLTLLVACGGDSKSSDDVSTDVTTADNQTPDDLVGTDTVLPDDVTEPEDGEPAEDNGADGSGDDVVGPVSGISPEMIESLCTDYCDEDMGCADVPYGDDCMAECQTKGEVEIEFLKVLACARNAESPAEYCDGLENCPDDLEILPACQEACLDVEACGALNTTFFGWSVADCELVCSASLGSNPEGQAILDCIGPALEACSGSEFVACIDPDTTPVCQELYCGEEVDPICALVPEPYETAEECLAVCEDWSAGQNIAAQACAEMGMEMPVDCHEALVSCQQVPETLPEGAFEYCEAFADKCGTVMVGELYEALGGLAFDFCGWQIAGITQIKPEGFRPLTEAVACVEELPFCPSGDLASLYCLINIPDELKTQCGTLNDLCAGEDEVLVQELIIDCEAAMGFASAFVPEAVEMITACLENAGSCGDVDQCFFGDEEEVEPTDPDPQ